MPTSTLSSLLRTLRDAKGASLRDVERETKVSNAYLSQLENGTASRPSADKLYSLAEYYGVPYERLLRAAGYIRGTNTDEARDPSVFETALMAYDLKSEEQRLVLKFIRNILRDEDSPE